MLGSGIFGSGERRGQRRSWWRNEERPQRPLKRARGCQGQQMTGTGQIFSLSIERIHSRLGGPTFFRFRALVMQPKKCIISFHKQELLNHL